MSINPFMKGFDEQALREMLEGSAKELNDRGVKVEIVYGDAGKLAVGQSAEVAADQGAVISEAQGETLPTQPETSYIESELNQ